MINFIKLIPETLYVCCDDNQESCNYRLPTALIMTTFLKTVTCRQMVGNSKKLFWIAFY